MKNIRKNYVTLAVAGVLGLGASVALAVDFPANATVQNVLAVDIVNEFELGTLFAVNTGDIPADGVGRLKISAADGSVSTIGTIAAGAPPLTSIVTPTPGTGTVSIVADFTLQFPNTATIDEAGMAGAGNTLAEYQSEAVPLNLDGGTGTEAALWLMHFTVSDVIGGEATEATANTGTFNVVRDGASTEYTFNIGATITTQPTEGTSLDYTAGLYSGTILIEASY